MKKHSEMWKQPPALLSAGVVPVIAPSTNNCRQDSGYKGASVYHVLPQLSFPTNPVNLSFFKNTYKHTTQYVIYYVLYVLYIKYTCTSIILNLFIITYLKNFLKSLEIFGKSDWHFVVVFFSSSIIYGISALCQVLLQALRKTMMRRQTRSLFLLDFCFQLGETNNNQIKQVNKPLKRIRPWQYPKGQLQ